MSVSNSIHLVTGRRSKSHSTHRLSIFQGLQSSLGRIKGYLHHFPNQAVRNQKAQGSGNLCAQPRHDNRQTGFAQLGADELFFSFGDGLNRPFGQQCFVPQTDHTGRNNDQRHGHNGNRNDSSSIHTLSPFSKQLGKRRLCLRSNDTIRSQAVRRLEFLDGLFSVCTEDAVLVDAQRPLKRGIIQPLRITAGRLFQISGAEDFSRPVRRIRCRTGHVGDSCIMIHRHIARFNVVDTDFPVQVTSGAVSRASLNADQVTRLQLLTCGHIDLRQMPKVHIVVRAPHPKHNALAKTLFGERCTLPSSANNRTVYRRVNVLVSDAHEVIALVICAI
nr:MAG TPA: hypothetical protein [Caudoviricetes sp.]